MPRRVKGRWSFLWKITFGRTRGKLLPPPSHSSPLSEVSRRRKKFWIDSGCSSSPYNCKQMWLLINWIKASGKFEENAEIKLHFHSINFADHAEIEAKSTKSAWRQDTTVFPRLLNADWLVQISPYARIRPLLSDPKFVYQKYFKTLVKNIVESLPMKVKRALSKGYL